MSQTERPAELAREAGRGRSPRTPAIALTAVTVVIACVVGVLAAIGLLLYYFA